MIFPKLTVAITLAVGAGAGCPFLGTSSLSKASSTSKNRPSLARFKNPRRLENKLTIFDYNDATYSNQRQGDGGSIPTGGYDAVRKDLTVLLTNSKAYWPADNMVGTDGPNYSGLFIRLAWHCNGTYRSSDGRGGCDGGDIRFSPVRDWPDNASLGRALKLLEPIKEKYGSSLSWGDLITLSGDTAIKSMGGPVIGFCGGRIDHPDGDESIPLGPSQIQHNLMPCGDEICPVGQTCPGCEAPLAAAEMGLIYVNPEGPVGKRGDMAASAEGIRDVFGRMGFNDRMTVAAIGGGHAFGKCHGACPSGEVDGDTGLCPGNSTWEDKFTSGLELQWTTRPTTWSNDYFNSIMEYNWTKTTSPGGALQWKPVGTTAPPIGMLTTDLALYLGDSEYEKLTMEYASDLDSLTKDFGEAWYQLMSRDMGPRERCLGDELPPMQAWETYLGPLTSPLPDYVPVRTMVQEAIDDNSDNLSAFSQLAMMCSSTYRSTDYRGGCNGARIRFSPEIDWESNAGAAGALKELEPIKESFPDVSWADLVVLAGQTAVEAAGGKSMAFCGGRVDAENGNASIGLEPVVYDNVNASTVYGIAQKGFSMEEGVALYATPADGSTQLSNAYFVDLKADGGDHPLLSDTLSLVVDAFAADNELFLSTYAMAWNYMVTSDLFDGPTKNTCQGVNVPTLPGSESPTTTFAPYAAPGSESPTAAPSAAHGIYTTAPTYGVAALFSFMATTIVMMI